MAQAHEYGQVEIELEDPTEQGFVRTKFSASAVWGSKEKLLESAYEIHRERLQIARESETGEDEPA